MPPKETLQNATITHHFCLDIGGTGTRGALFSVGGEELARAEGMGGALSLGVDRSRDAILAVWQQILDRVKSGEIDMDTTALWAGIAGISLKGRPTQLAESLGGFAGVRLVSDGYGALLGASGGRPGALISVGTGVIAQRLDEDGNTLALGGWGLPAGDLGSGAWIGLKLFGALSKHLDGVALDPPLDSGLAEACLEITGSEYGKIHHWHHMAAPRDFAALAPHVVAHAEAGDSFCTGLLVAAAQEIVLLGRALFCDNAPGKTDGERQTIHLAGGLGAILLPFCIKEGLEFIWDSSPIDPILGIHLLAEGKAPPERQLPRPGLEGLAKPLEKPLANPFDKGQNN